jgi:hypothetical protein
MHKRTSDTGVGASDQKCPAMQLPDHSPLFFDW